MNSKKNELNALVECAVFIAIGTVLMQIKIINMPFGGSVTLVSMLPLILVSFRRGIKWGIFSGIINSAIQMIFGFSAPLSASLPAFFAVILLDYLLAFTSLAFSSAFVRFFKSPIISSSVGCVFVCFLRFLCSFISGALIWGSYKIYYKWADGMSVWLYSLIYNASYMLPETLFTTVAIILIAKFYPKLLERQ